MLLVPIDLAVTPVFRVQGNMQSYRRDYKLLTSCLEAMCQSGEKSGPVFNFQLRPLAVFFVKLEMHLSCEVGDFVETLGFASCV